MAVELMTGARSDSTGGLWDHEIGAMFCHPMRFIHTSDWHLGKRLLGHSLIDDQAHALTELERLCVSEEVHALVIAGDVFDRAVPPVEAVELLDDFLERMALRTKIPVVMISGNHDGPERLGFAGRLLQSSGITVRTRLRDRTEPWVLEQGGETTLFYGLPYLEPEAVRTELDDDTVDGHEAAVRAALVAIRADARGRQSDQTVLVAHLFCAGGEPSPESERPLAAGGAVHVPADALKGFSYVALGHLHRPQKIWDRIRYAGSLLKYSIEEHAQDKSVNLVELTGRKLRVQPILISPKRNVVLLEAPFDALLHDKGFDGHAYDYVAAYYTDTTYVYQASELLRGRFPYLLQALPSRLRDVQAQDPDTQLAARPDAPRELLKAFWSFVDAPSDLEPAHFDAFERALAIAHRQSR